jgi:hypothetical protein
MATSRLSLPFAGTTNSAPVQPDATQRSELAAHSRSDVRGRDRFLFRLLSTSTSTSTKKFSDSIISGPERGETFLPVESVSPPLAPPPATLCATSLFQNAQLQNAQADGAAAHLAGISFNGKPQRTEAVAEVRAGVGEPRNHGPAAENLRFIQMARNCYLAASCSR